MLVNGSDFYCGNSSGSLCQLALKNQIPSQYVHPSTKQCNYTIDTSQFALKTDLSGIPGKYDKPFVSRNAEGAVEYVSDTLDTVSFTFKGATTDSKTFSFTYTSPYPIWFGSFKCSGSYSSSGRQTCTITGSINGHSFNGSLSGIYTGNVVFSGETVFSITVNVEYSSSSSSSEITFNAPIVFTHNYY